MTFSGLTIAASATVTTSSSFSIAGALTTGASAVFNPERWDDHPDGDGLDIVLERGTDIQGSHHRRHTGAQPTASFSVSGALTVNGSTTLAPMQEPLP